MRRELAGTKLPRELERDAVRRGNRRVECLFGVLPLLDGDITLPVGETGERKREHEAGGKAPGEQIAPPCRATPALGDERLRFFRRRRRVGWSGGNPALGVFQHRRTQQETAGAAGRGPFSGGFAIFGMLPDPADVGCKRVAQALEARGEFRLVVEKDKVEAAERLGHEFVVDPLHHNRRETLVEGRSMPDFLRADLRGDRIRTQCENDGIALLD